MEQWVSYPKWPSPLSRARSDFQRHCPIGFLQILKFPNNIRHRKLYSNRNFTFFFPVNFFWQFWSLSVTTVQSLSAANQTRRTGGKYTERFQKTIAFRVMSCEHAAAVKRIKHEGRGGGEDRSRRVRLKRFRRADISCLAVCNLYHYCTMAIYGII